MTSILPPLHPGGILREVYLGPLHMSAGSWQRGWVFRARIERLAGEQTGITPDTALRLGKFFGTSPEFCMNMQASYDLKMTAQSLERDLVSIIRFKDESRAT